MQLSKLKLSFPNKTQNLVILMLVGISISIAFYSNIARNRSPDSAGKYPFRSPEIGSVSRQIQREIAFYQKRIDRQPDAGLDRAALAQAYLKMARATGESSWYLLSEQMARQSLEKLPFNNHEAMMVLAKISTAKHNFNNSLSILKQLPIKTDTLSLKIPNYLALGDLKNAQKDADTLVKKMPISSNLTMRALVKFAGGDDRGAIRDFKAAIEVEEPDEASNSALTRTLLGRLYYKRGQLQTAEELYRSALEISPRFAPALLNLAELSVRQWQRDPMQTKYQQQAIELYDRFFTFHRNQPTVYDHIALRGLARVYRLQGDGVKAGDTWQQAVSKLRSDLTGFGHQRELAQLLLERGQSADLTEALSLMQAEIKNRQDPETWGTLATAYFKTNQLNEAEKAIDMALKSGIRDPGLLDRAAEIAKARSQFTRSQTYREQIKSIDPNFDNGARQALGLGVGLSGLN